MNIESLANCTGCTACFASCKMNAITMVENSEGFLFPKINRDQCRSCGKCDSVCPVINPSEHLPELPPAFAAVNRDDEIREKSSSGGVFWVLVKFVLAKGGVVFGVKFDKSWRVVHDYAENEEDAKAFRKSKYIQSDLGDSFRKCKAFLDCGRTVLFTGSPCQVNGLKAFLNKDYPNLICADFICYGAPSPKLWGKYTSYLEEERNSKIKNILFRSKRHGWKKSVSDSFLIFEFENGSKLVYNRRKHHSPYRQIFFSCNAHRNSCYNCPAQGFKRASDITFADYWKVRKIHPEWNDDRGMSRLWLNTPKTRETASALRTHIEAEMHLIKIGENEPGFLDGYFNSPSKPKERASFFNDLEHQSLLQVLRKYGDMPLWEWCYLSLRRIVKRGKI